MKCTWLVLCLITSVGCGTLLDLSEVNRSRSAGESGQGGQGGALGKAEADAGDAQSRTGGTFSCAPGPEQAGDAGRPPSGSGTGGGDNGGNDAAPGAAGQVITGGTAGDQGHAGAGGTRTGPAGSGGGGAAGASGDSQAGAAGATPDPCEPNPCQNGGECQRQKNGALCHCTRAYAGDRCEVLNARTCLDWLRMEESDDGVYRVDADGAGDGEPFDVYCDMTTLGGGWTLVASLRAAGPFAGHWGTDHVNLSAPSPTADYLLDFRSRLPDPGQVMMRHEASATWFAHTILYDPMQPALTWETQEGTTGLRRRVVADGQYLIFSDGSYEGAPDYFCVNSGTLQTENEPPGFNCDGGSGQAQGQGLFNGSAFGDTACQTVWKSAPGEPEELTCNPADHITVWFREPAASCAELRDLGVTEDGAYTLDPDGLNGDRAPFTVYCDMTLKGGGWTLVAINGLTPRPVSWKDNPYPRPGASFYGSIEVALGELPALAAGDLVGTQYSVRATELYAGSHRQFLAYVGGSTSDYLHGVLPDGCNYFDGRTFCPENSGASFPVYDGQDRAVTQNAQACTSAHREPPYESDPYDEFGLHLLDGTATGNGLHCYATASLLGHERVGRLYTTLNGSLGGSGELLWASGVHSHWSAEGDPDQPGYLMIR